MKMGIYCTEQLRELIYENHPLTADDVQHMHDVMLAETLQKIRLDDATGIEDQILVLYTKGVLV